jgi:ATP-dependent Clp protease ATP-binding subunit ClpE
LAKQLAYELFGSKDSMIRFDMSEYMEKHSVSKLIGSPPGYVGYEEAGQLTEQVRRNPYSLILAG